MLQRRQPALPVEGLAAPREARQFAGDEAVPSRSLHVYAALACRRLGVAGEEPLAAVRRRLAAGGEA